MSNRRVPERITRQLLAVLEAFMDDPSRDLYGLEIMELAHISSGTLYPILHRLVDDGWILRACEAPSGRGGPARRMYRLTAAGRLHAIELFEERGLSKRHRKVEPLQPEAQPA